MVKMGKKQREFLDVFRKAFGNVSVATRLAGIHRSTYYDWCEKYEGFKEACEEAIEIRLDMAEDQLNKLCVAGNLGAIIFTLKTLGKSRGYIERHELAGPSDGASSPISIEIVDSRKAVTVEVPDAEGTND